MLFSLTKVSGAMSANCRTSFNSSKSRNFPAAPNSANAACAVRRHIEVNALNAPAVKQSSASLNSSSTFSGKYMNVNFSRARSTSVNCGDSSMRLVP